MDDMLASLRSALAGRYRVDRTLGAGGMATVYLAWDIRHDRPVAIKVLHPDLAHAVGGERFEREIRVAARLSHPHILTLHDSGIADGLPYYVMPYVEGESLRDRLRRERILPLGDAVDIAREVAEALSYAHAMGVVHRDIKPENILLSDRHALVADFGIARALHDVGGDALTQTNTSVGTPLYMSPEQSHGEVVGPSSDVYSLACVLYEMLTGAPPFTGATAQAIMARHSLDPVPSVRTVRDTVPAELEAVVMAALNKLSADRPPSAQRFREMLGSATDAIAGRQPTPPTLGVHGTATERPPLRSGHSRLAVRWVAIAALASMAAVAIWKVTRSGEGLSTVALGPNRSRLAVLYFEDFSRDHGLDFLATGLTEGLIDALAGVNGLSVVSRGGVASYRTTRVTRDSIARALHVGTLIVGLVEPEADSVRVTVRLLDEQGIELDRASFKRIGVDLVGLMDTLPLEVARLIRRQLGTSVALSLSRAGTRSTEAWALYQRGVLAGARGDSLFRAGDLEGHVRQYATADSLASVASRIDPRWMGPIILRGHLQYWRSRRTRQDIDERVARADSGLRHVNRVLDQDPGNAEALELRGNIRYWRWLSRFDTAASVRGALLAAAQKDLETAAAASPPRPGAWASLSHLYYQLPEKTSVDILYAASKALELDAYLSNADVVYHRLILGSFDAERLSDADRWCREARGRFPADPRFVTCALWVALSGFTHLDASLAWALLDTAVTLTPGKNERSALRMEGTFIVAGILARGGLVDSARRVLDRTPLDTLLDPLRESVSFRGYAALLAGDREEALKTLSAYYNFPENRRGVAGPAWWFRELAQDPRYRAMVGADVDTSKRR